MSVRYDAGRRFVHFIQIMIRYRRLIDSPHTLTYTMSIPFLDEVVTRSKTTWENVLKKYRKMHADRVEANRLKPRAIKFILDGREATSICKN